LPDDRPARPCHSLGVKQTNPLQKKEKKMMGQQQIVAEQAGGALRRTLVLMTVVALMVVMLAVSVSPAFATRRGTSHAIETACTNSLGKAFSGGPGSGSC
jgi:hypothetical protein